MKRKQPETVTLEVFKKPRTQQVTRTVVKQGGATRTFVPRSMGTPLAITERKYFDTDYNSVSIPNIAGASWASAEADPATLLSLFQPTRGTDFNNVEGRKCKVLAIKLRGFIASAAQVDQTAGDGMGYVRLIVYQDKQTNAAQAQAEELMASGSATTNNVCCFQNPANFGRFQVLKDKVVTLGNPNISYDGTNIEQQGVLRAWKINIKFKKPVDVHFNSTNGGTIADTVDNSFHVIAACQSSALALTLAYKGRVVFIDA